MGLTERNTATCREVRRPRAKSPLLKFATGLFEYPEHPEGEIQASLFQISLKGESEAWAQVSTVGGVICFLKVSELWCLHLF